VKKTKKKKKAMMNEDFFALIPGAIGEIIYYKSVDVESDPKNNQNFVDEMSREILYAFQPPKGLSSSEYTVLFQNEFIKARQRSLEDLRKSKICRFSVLTQVANAECLEEIERIETDPDFKGWENESFVKELKKIR
jgi:hypothetical protein